MSAAEAVDLAAYFDRIGYGGEAMPTAAALAGIVQSHAATIPFDTLDAFMHGHVDIAPAAVDAKLIDQRRGGYCYEHNGLMRRVLIAMGFDVVSLVGRVLYGRDDHEPLLPRLHQALKVSAEGIDWLIDVGNGIVTPSAPLRIDTESPQETPHGPYRVLTTDDGDLVVQAHSPEAWKSIYRLSPQPQLPQDFEPANWYNAAHPDSWLRQNLVAALSPGGARISLWNNRLKVMQPGAEPTEMILDAAGIERALTEVFGMPVDAAWRPHLQRAVDIAEAWAGGAAS